MHNLRNVNQLWNSNWKDFRAKNRFRLCALSLPIEKFVVRGGFGILYNRQNDNIFANIRQDIPQLLQYRTLLRNSARALSALAHPLPAAKSQFYYRQ